ncbi:MAG TPA: YhdP family protein [Gammaproteobacteria bacterium]|nr:YhdP family protein [Gammaproteobacteria bacterium]
MSSFLRKLAKVLGVGLAGLVILAAIGVGAFRLIVAELPAYQGQVRAWAEDVLGLRVSFSRLDARWGLRGPELTFLDASVARLDDAAAPMISAGEVTLGLSPLARILERRLVVDRLVLDRTELTVERSIDGGLHLQGAPPEDDTTSDLELDDLPSVEIALDDSDISYVDRVRGTAWTFGDVRARLIRDDDRVLLEIRGTPPPDLGTRVEISVDGALGGETTSAESDWLVVAQVDDVNLAAIASALPESPMLPRGGSGDVSLWLDFRGSQLRQATARVALEDLRLGDADEAASSSYDDLAVTAEWLRDERGWRLSLTDLLVSRDALRWPQAVNVSVGLTGDPAAPASIEIESDFLRVQDLAPLIAALPEQSWTSTWARLQPRGDLRDLSLQLARTDRGVAYTAAVDFIGLGVVAADGRPGIAGISGSLRGDTDSGRLELATVDAELEWPEIFRERLAIGELSGILVWRQGRDGLRIVSDDLRLDNADARTRSNLELIVPPDGGVPQLDLALRLVDFDTTRTSHYLPVGKLPAPVVRWLDRAIVQGRVPEADVTFFGPIDAFPFDNGEGQLRARFSVENGVLAYTDGWPVARDISGEVEFVNAGFSARGSGRLLDSDRTEVAGGVADVREAVLEVSGDVGLSLGELLNFLRTVPVTARRLGPDLSRLQSSQGSGELGFELTLPLKDVAAYDLSAVLAMDGGALSVDGFDLTARDIAGDLRLTDNVVTGDGITATLLGSPVVAAVAPADEAGYRARLEVSGVLGAAALREALDVPLASYVEGEAQWQGRLLLPSNVGDTTGARAPLRLEATSDLRGASLGFPAPLGKVAEQPLRLELGVAVLPLNRFDIEGRLGPQQRFALSFWNTDAGPLFQRGSLRLDGAYPLLPPDDGLDIDGQVGELALDEWLALLRAQHAANRDEPVLSRLDLEIEDLTAFGQGLGPATLAVRQGRDEWLVELDSDAVAGHIVVPFGLRARPQIVADMQRLHLAFADAPSAEIIDPRDLPGLLINSQDFSVGERQLGRLSANIQADPLGLRLVSYQSVRGSYAVEGSGSWFAGVQGATTRFAFSLLSQDVAATLNDLGLQPLVEAESLQVTGSVNWPGGPSPRWQQSVSGDLSLHIDEGSVINLEPGAGRMWGLLSFTALPRRLALDFRDVFNRGLVFDEVAGDFVIVDGNAYTDNLLLTGPVADIGVVGRTGLRNEDYQQQAVVTAEPGKVLPTMGFLASPGIGAALLLFTQIFKEPLKGIGRASYCVSGDWDAPVVERLTPEQLEAGYLCADLPPSAATVAETTE